jgi:hypothetical protein
MGQTGPDRRQTDPLAILTNGMRRIGSLDLEDVKRGLAMLANPDGNFLDALGRTRAERVEKMAAMLRNSSEADIEEMGIIFGLAMAKVAEEQTIGSPAPAKRRRPTSAERREERRLAY